MELEPGIHQLTIGQEPFKGFPPPNAFLVCGTEASVLIDAGWDSEADHAARMAYLHEAGAPPLSEVIVTHRHPDHGGGAAAMHVAAGVPLTCHPADREIIERDRLQGRAPVDREVTGGEVRELGGLTVHVLHAPGHTMGCLALYVPERGALFTTDTVMAISTTVIRPEDGDLVDYANTLRKFQEIGARTMYTGHGGPVRDPAARLATLLEHRRQREEELIDALAEGPRTVPELRAAIYVDLPEIRHPLAEAQIATGLKKLVAEGAARAEDDRFALVR